MTTQPDIRRRSSILTTQDMGTQPDRRRSSILTSQPDTIEHCTPEDIDDFYDPPLPDDDFNGVEFFIHRTSCTNSKIYKS